MQNFQSQRRAGHAPYPVSERARQPAPSRTHPADRVPSVEEVVQDILLILIAALGVALAANLLVWALGYG